MWIASENGFFSIVKHNGDADKWLIRARAFKDLSGAFPEERIKVIDQADYRFRVEVTRQELTSFLLDQGDIDYTNFKNHVAATSQRDKLPYYSKIWGIMYDYQREIGEGQ